MSVLEFLSHGGMAKIGGDLPEAERKIINSKIKTFAIKLSQTGQSLQVPASILKVRQSTYLFAGKDKSGYHIIFADAPGDNQLNYRDFTQLGIIELTSIVHQVRIEIGDVIWAFTIPYGISDAEQDIYIEKIVMQYVHSVLESQNKPDKKISEEAINHPDIASGIERLRKDYGINQKTAFIIMQFGNTIAHKKIVEVVKKTLLKHNIIGLRADDKEYLDDLFPNVKVYLHTCTFGIAIFDRLTEDDFNPNVSLEVGYLFGMGKDVLLMKDKTLKSLHTDLTGKLYKEFDPQDIDNSLPPQINKWLKDKGVI